MYTAVCIEKVKNQRKTLNLNEMVDGAMVALKPDELDYKTITHIICPDMS